MPPIQKKVKGLWGKNMLLPFELFKLNVCEKTLREHK